MNLDILSLKRKLLIKYPFFGRVISNLKFVETDSLDTAATDGKIVYYNKDFFESLKSVDEQVFLLAHEICHVAFNHILRSENKNQRVWNIATDAVINQLLKSDGFPIIEGGIDIEEAINYDAEEMYKRLLSEEENKGNNKENEENVGHDSHDMWSKAVEDTKKAKDDKKSKTILDKIFGKNKEKQINKTDLEETQEEIAKMGEGKSFEENKKERRKQIEKLKQNIAKNSLNSSGKTEYNKREVGEIGKSKSIIDWRYILKEALNYGVDWSYQNAFIEDGVMVPNLEEMPIPETEILLDTSGSISEDLLKNFLRETKNILGYSKIKAGCFDVRFYGFHDIRSETDIEDMTFNGGGGTDFNVAVNAFSRRVENKIIFTDGEADMPDMNIDAIWIVFGNTKIKPRGGKVIYISDEQLDELCSMMVVHSV